MAEAEAVGTTVLLPPGTGYGAAEEAATGAADEADDEAEVHELATGALV